MATRQTGMRDPFPIVCALGERFKREATGLRDAKALVLLVARAGDPETAWPCAHDLAVALGFSEDYIERMLYEAYTPAPTGDEPPARGTR